MSPFQASSTWSIQSKLRTSTDKGFGIVFGEGESVIYHVSSDSATTQYLVSRISAASGAVSWTYAFPYVAPKSCHIDFYSSSANNYLFVAGLGAFSLHRLTLAAATGSVVQTEFFFEGAYPNLKTMASYVINQNSLVYLLTGATLSLNQVILATVTLSGASSTILYKRTMPMYTGTPFNSVFVSSTKFYYGLSGTTDIYQTQGGTPKSLSAGALVIGSSEQSESCQTLQGIGGTQKVFAYLTPGATLQAPSTFFTSNTVTMNSDSTTTSDLKTSSFTQIDSWCTYSGSPVRYSIASVTQASLTLSYRAGSASSCPITPFSATISCGTTPATFAYSGFQYDTSALPSFMSVSSTTGTISVTSASTLGNHSIVIYALLPNKQTTSAVFTVIGYGTPTFVSSISSVTVSVGQTQTTVLPATSDPSNLWVTVSTPVLQGSSSLPAFVTYRSGTKTLQHRPTLFSQVGSYTLSVTISNAYLSNTYTFCVVVQNRAPVFATALSTLVTVLVGQTVTYTLPSCTDPDGNAVTITQISLPSFAQYNSGTYSITPMSISQLGSYTVNVDACDGAPLCSSFQFIIRVQSGPVFSSSTPTTISVNMNSPTSFILPSYSDPQNYPITFNTFEHQQPILPAFATYDPSTTTYMFSPTSYLQMGTYTIDAEACNSVSVCTTYVFFVDFSNSPPAFSSSIPSTSIIVTVGSTRTFTLPAISDPDGDAFTLTISEPGSSTIPSFLTFSDSIFTIRPRSNSDVGNYTINAKACDAEPKCSVFAFTISVALKQPPAISSDVSATLYVNINSPSYLTLVITHPLGFPFTVYPFYSCSPSYPAFASFNQTSNQYTFAPSSSSTEGFYSITAKACDNQPLCSSFTINVIFIKVAAIFEKPQSTDTQPVINSIIKGLIQKLSTLGPPSFASPLTALTIEPGKLTEYQLPEVIDLDNDSVSTTINLQDAAPFTAFTQGRFIFTPGPQQVRDSPYVIKITLQEDSIQKLKRVYLFQVTVTPNQDNSVTGQVNQTSAESAYQVRQGLKPGTLKYNATLLIRSISKIGVVTLKVLAPSLGDVIASMLSNSSVQFFWLKQPKLRQQELSFEVMRSDENQVFVQLNFSNPEEVSISSELDIVQVKLLKSIQVLSGNDFVELLEGATSQSTVPPQISLSDEEFVQGFKKAAYAVTLSIAPTTIVLNFFLAMMLNYLWGLINDLSYLMMLSFISVAVPGIAQDIQAALLQIIYIDMFQSSSWMPSLLESPHYQDQYATEQALSGYFEMNGYRSLDVIDNLGSTTVFIGLFILSHILAVLLRPWISKSQRVNKIYAYLADRLYWNSSLRFLIQQFTPIVLASFINMHHIIFETVLTCIFSATSITLLIASHAAIILIFKSIRTAVMTNSLRSPEFQKKFGMFFEGLSLKNGVSVHWNLIFFLRWSLTLSIIVFMKEYPAFQILSILSMSLLYQTIAVLFKPFTESYDNISIIFNELLVSAYLYTLLGLTANTVCEQKVKVNMGWTLLIIVFISTAGNLLKTIILVSREVIHLKRKRDARLRYEAKTKKHPQGMKNDGDNEAKLPIQSSNINFSEQRAERKSIRDDQAHVKRRRKNKKRKKKPSDVPQPQQNEDNKTNEMKLDQQSAMARTADQNRPQQASRMFKPSILGPWGRQALRREFEDKGIIERKP